jgi:hypothetical protein
MRSEVVHHWWNTAWGGCNRRDVHVRAGGVTFEVEVRLDGFGCVEVTVTPARSCRHPRR